MFTLALYTKLPPSVTLAAEVVRVTLVASNVSVTFVTAGAGSMVSVSKPPPLEEVIVMAERVPAST